MGNEQKGGRSRGAGVGFHHIEYEDRRADQLFEPGRVVILDAKEYELLLRVATQISNRTKRVLAVLTPLDQLNEDGTPLAEGRVRVVKSGPLYDQLFEPIRKMREGMVKEKVSQDIIEQTIANFLEADIAELNEGAGTVEVSEEPHEDYHDVLR